jgi:mannitol 2-dehydrogenase
VDEAAQDPQIARLVSRYMDDEATPTLQPVPGVDLGAYKATLLERLGNPYVRDTLARLATDGSDRIPKFVVPVARERRALGQDASVSAAIIAAWARYAELAIDGAQLPFSDRQRSRIEEAVSRQRSEPAGFLRNDDWFGELADDSVFCEDFSAAYRALLESADIDAVLDHILGSAIGGPTS